MKSGDLDQSPSELFRKHFTDNLHDFLLLSPESIVLLVPSIRDIVSHHPVFPQCELGLEFCGGDSVRGSLFCYPQDSIEPKRIKMLPNPCRFMINHVSFAVSSVDVISHLKKEEFYKHGQEVDSLVDDFGSDAMGAACRHVLRQRR